MSNLSESHLLYKLKKGCPTGSVKRKDLEADLAISKGIYDSSRVRANLDTYNLPELKAVRNVHHGIGLHIKAESLVWGGGWWLIPNKKIGDIQTFVANEKMKAQSMYEEFIQAIAGHIERDRIALGSAFREGDYPSVEKLRRAWYINEFVAPVPDPELDIRAGWPAETKRIFVESTLKQQEHSIAVASVDLADRMLKVVTHVHERLSGYNGTASGSYRNNLNDAIKDIASKLDDFNITDSPDLKLIKEKMIRIASVDPEDTRQDDKLREETAKRAEDVISRIGKFGQGFQNQIDSDPGSDTKDD